MTVGHSDVRCCGDMRMMSTRKQRNTCAWIVGIDDTFRLSVSRSVNTGEVRPVWFVIFVLNEAENYLEHRESMHTADMLQK